MFRKPYQAGASDENCVRRVEIEVVPKMSNQDKAALLLSLIVCLPVSDARVFADRPNVLFVVADDLNCAIGPYGDRIAHTPNLDRLAAQGVVFDRAYCQQAVCNPSRSSFLTGLRPNTVGVDDLRKYFRNTVADSQAVVTLPEHFLNAGYYCRNIGKMFHNMGDSQDRQSWSVDEVLHKGPHSEDTIYRSRAPNNKLSMKAPVTEALDVNDTAYRDGRIAELAAEAIRSYPKGDAPFFLAVGFWRPHLPFVAPKKYWDLYIEEEIASPQPPVPPAGAPDIALHESREISGYGDRRKSAEFSDRDVRHFRHGYYASISFLDAQVGKLLDALADSGHDKNTIVVFTSDHGFHVGEHALWGKTTNFELDARVPLIIAAPSHAAAEGEHSAAICELIDLYPTLADLAQIPVPEQLQLEGTSLVPVLENTGATVKEFALTQHQQPFYGSRKNWRAIGYSLRSRRWRFTQWKSIENGSIVATELYDHAVDPLETVNVAERPENADAVQTLEKQLWSLVD
ncbi:MAG: sulfatase [Aureliella sp.]